MSAEAAHHAEKADPVFTGRIEVLYALGRHYLSLPFAVLCVPAALLAGKPPTVLPLMPLLLQLVVVCAAEQLTTAYKNRPPGSDPHFWARRYTFVSGIAGATWGIGVPFWFVWNSFPAQAYLALAFLGMTATEFIARSAHRPAYAVHVVFSLGPLIAALLIQGGLYATMTAILVGFFGAVLVSYCNGMARLLDESVYLRNENTDLVARLSRENEEAIAARDEARASARAKSAFIANISHELRTPMNALLGMAQLLERANLSKQQLDHVKVMLEAGRGLQTLLDDVIALTRDDDAPVEDEDCDPVQAARAVSRLLQPRAWEKRLRLTLTAPPELPRVAADPRRVRQALLKLADNALKFTDRGLVDIRLEPETASDGRRFVRFVIADTGHGVAREAAQFLFKPFSPGDSSYTRSQQGAGLGLSVAKRIVDQAGGAIGFESEPGAGAQFWFTLPVSGHEAFSVNADFAAASENRRTPPSDLSILAFLRAPNLAVRIANLLEPFGNQVTVAPTAAEAVARAARDRFDAIVAGAADADMLAAAPGVKAPIVAMLMRGDHAPACAREILRWPVSADALYTALDAVARPGEVKEAAPKDAATAPIDAQAFSTLEKSVGAATLVDILQCYIATAEELTQALDTACREEKWTEAARLAQDIGGAAGGLGLMAVTEAARGFTQKTRSGEAPETLRSAANMVIGEHVRTRRALGKLYPDLVA